MPVYVTNTIIEVIKTGAGASPSIVQGFDLSTQQKIDIAKERIDGFQVRIHTAIAGSTSEVLVDIRNNAQTGAMTSAMPIQTLPFSSYNTFASELWGTGASLNGLTEHQAQTFVADMTHSFIQFSVASAGMTMYTANFDIHIFTSADQDPSGAISLNGLVKLTSGKISL